jgi:hypothetical protein
MGKYKLTAVVAIIALLIGVALGIAVSWAVGTVGKAETEILEGFAWVNENGTAIGLSPDGETPGPSYVVAGAMWREEGGPWHDVWPTCLVPTMSDQRVRLGLLQVEPQEEAPGRAVVLWLECLD